MYPPPKDFVETVLVLESNTGNRKPFPNRRGPSELRWRWGFAMSSNRPTAKSTSRVDSKKLGKLSPAAFSPPASWNLRRALRVNPKQSGRLELAQWLTRGDHPQTARVLVNRIWQHLFGDRHRSARRMILESMENARLIRSCSIIWRFASWMNGWSIKKLIRNIVLSRTYQLSSHAADATITVDSGATLLSHHQRRAVGCRIFARLHAASKRTTEFRTRARVRWCSTAIFWSIWPATCISPVDIAASICVTCAVHRHRELAAFDLPEFHRR